MPLGWWGGEPLPPATTPRGPNLLAVWAERERFAALRAGLQMTGRGSFGANAAQLADDYRLLAEELCAAMFGTAVVA